MNGNEHLGLLGWDVNEPQPIIFRLIAAFFMRCWRVYAAISSTCR